MRRVLWLVFVAWFGAAACGINTEPTGAGTGPDAGASGGSGGGGGTGGGQNNCFPSPDQKFCGGTLCPLKTDPAHGCASSSCAACSVPGATANCAPDGSCGIESCNAGFSDCDANAANGCEINTDSDPTNCGSCGHDCFAKDPGTNWVCKQGQCAVSNCPAGRGDCNNDPSDACEVDLNTDPKNCKFCTNDCSTTVLHATPSCTAGVCGYTKCDAGWADCDGDTTNGCEQDVATDPLHCGGCDSNTFTCSNANGKPACVNQQCTISCSGSYGNCDNNVKNGCESNLDTDLNHCGSCNKVCGKGNDAPACSGGQCTLNCKTGFDSCDGNNSNGCETALNTDTHCGSCGNACTGGKTCNNGSCQCGAGQVVDGSGNCCTQESVGAACGNKCNTTATDNCDKTVSCPSTCGGGKVCFSNTCCTKKACGDYSGQCGSLSDGCGGNIMCNCGGSDVCNGGTCCTPKTCASLGATCGSPGDGCGNTLSCGSCGANATCNGSNSCVCDSGYATCGPNCTAYDDKHCGKSCTDCTQNSGGLCDTGSGSCCYSGNHSYDCTQTGITCCPGTTCHSSNGHCY